MLSFCPPPLLFDSLALLCVGDLLLVLLPPMLELGLLEMCRRSTGTQLFLLLGLDVGNQPPFERRILRDLGLSRLEHLAPLPELAHLLGRRLGSGVLFQRQRRPPELGQLDLQPMVLVLDEKQVQRLPLEVLRHLQDLCLHVVREPAINRVQIVCRGRGRVRSLRTRATCPCPCSRARGSSCLDCCSLSCGLRLGVCLCLGVCLRLRMCFGLGQRLGPRLVRLSLRPCLDLSLGFCLGLSPSLSLSLGLPRTATMGVRARRRRGGK